MCAIVAVALGSESTRGCAPRFETLFLQEKAAIASAAVEEALGGARHLCCSSAAGAPASYSLPHPSSHVRCSHTTALQRGCARAHSKQALLLLLLPIFGPIILSLVWFGLSRIPPPDFDGVGTRTTLGFLGGSKGLYRNVDLINTMGGGTAGCVPGQWRARRCC